jgi:outer membrane lipoprotein SlyB
MIMSKSKPKVCGCDTQKKGAAGGAAAGAAIGAAVGGPVGAVVGGIVGGITGCGIAHDHCKNKHKDKD